MALCSFQNGNFENPVQETRIYGLPPRFQDVGCHFAGSPCNIEFLKKKKKMLLEGADRCNHKVAIRVGTPFEKRKRPCKWK